MEIFPSILSKLKSLSVAKESVLDSVSEWGRWEWSLSMLPAHVDEAVDGVGLVVVGLFTLFDTVDMVEAWWEDVEDCVVVGSLGMVSGSTTGRGAGSNDWMEGCLFRSVPGGSDKGGDGGCRALCRFT